MPLEKKDDECPACKGYGYFRDYERMTYVKCKSCNGSGRTNGLASGDSGKAKDI